MSNLEAAYALDRKIRIEDEKLPAEGVAIAIEEFDSDGIVYDSRGLRVIAFEVDHGAAIKPAYGYRIDYAGRSVVISGDTRYNQNVIKYGANADLLIHEVAIARPELLSEPFIQRIMATRYASRRVAWSLGENLAWGTGELSTPQAIMNAWMNSAGHKANILKKAYKEVGISVRLGVPTDAGVGATVTADFGAKV